MVIAIVGMWEAMLFPVFSQARESARRAVCGSNLRQIGTALQMYNMDHTERMPGGGAVGNEWATSLLPYTGSTQLFACSSNASSGGPTLDGTSRLSYEYNSLVVDGAHYGFDGADGSGVSLSTIDQPSETICIVDLEAANAVGNAAKITTVAQLDTGPDASRLVANRHLGGFNALYGDGHVHWHKAGSTKVADWTVQSD